jgi:hypothetical protein
MSTILKAIGLAASGKRVKIKTRSPEETKVLIEQTRTMCQGYARRESQNTIVFNTGGKVRFEEVIK